MLWPLLFMTLKRFGVTTICTHSFPDFGSSVTGRAALGSASEERGSAIRNVLEGVVAGTDYYLELVQEGHRERSNRTSFRFVSAYDQELWEPLFWDKRTLQASL